MISTKLLRWSRREASHRRLEVVAFVGLVLLLQGCAERRPRAYPWATALTVKPVLRKPLVPPASNLPSLDDDTPDLRLDFPPPPSKLVIVRTPARPRVAVAPAVETSGNSKPEPLSLEPQLSEKDIAVAHRQVNESIAVAQNNLAAAKGHRLNATQADLASKVTSFIEESKSAALQGDWNRARNLAKKAQVLSEELAESL